MSIGLLYFILFIIAIIALLIALFLTGSIAVFFITHVPFVPTPKRNVKIIIDRLNLKPGKVFYDIGCGDGRFLLAAEKYGVKAIGFEISPWAFLRGKFNLWRHKSKARIFYKNFYDTKIKDADVVVCFLINTVMPKVEKKLEQELKPGARVASFGFKLPTWQPTEIIDLKPNNKHQSRIYFYQKI